MCPCCRDLQLEGELYNGRLAMLAAVGILTVEYLGKGPWWTAPVAVSLSWTLNSHHHAATGPGWRGSVQILSTMPTVDWALLGPGESNKG
jgi:hypothetical protein